MRLSPPWFCVLSLTLLAGCKTHLDPVSYSADYQVRSGTDGRVELTPIECLKPSASDEFALAEDYRPTLAPGCANALNLLQMVEQRQDVVQGRATGPTMAAPVGRAAQVYIDGYDREELRRRQAEQQSSVNAREGQ
ncbi:hypothetical protein [Pseudomonas fluorescens]|uniref:Lipoprotein n=1 Tax=Pseudomonas fluorescens TaxID=294 RepID=A0A0F4V9E3_PSEFL|nr:hypothetical protein [Pseudomonas fluorescens]KJZ64577.1 hypothetical protein VD17_17025 [Pseudomonas fluorescens]